MRKVVDFPFVKKLTPSYVINPTTCSAWMWVALSSSTHRNVSGLSNNTKQTIQVVVVVLVATNRNMVTT